MTDKLKQEILAFLSEVEAAAKEEGRKASATAYETALAEKQAAFDAQVAALTAEYNNKVQAAYKEGYDKAEADAQSAGSSGQPSMADPTPDDPVHEGYSRDKVIAELLAIKGSKSVAFGIVDVNGNVYADVAEYALDGKPAAIGIGYTDGTHHLCMLPKKIAAASFGASGMTIKGAYTTKKQWRNSATAEVPAFDDYQGVSNTFAIMNAAEQTIASKCCEMVAANGKHGYLPACAEQRVFCKYFKTVDNLLTAIGGDKLKTQNGAQVLWSSTCRDITHAWAVRYMNEGDAQPQYNAKTKSLSCRVFVEL